VVVGPESVHGLRGGRIPLMLFRARDKTFDLTNKALIVGIVNATPDSFSDGDPMGIEHAERRATELAEQGADVIEVGGESNVSNRPAVEADEEIERVVPAVEAAAATGLAVAIDTYKPPVAAAAIEAGATIVNDISGLGDPLMHELVASTGAGTVLMHTETPPKQVRWEEDLYPEGLSVHLTRFFEDRLATLAAAGIGAEQVALDPGPDFAKTPRQTVESLRALSEISVLGRPVYLAVSRKDFIGALTHTRPSERGPGTYAALASGLLSCGRLLRVHDVVGTRRFLTVWEALNDPAFEVPADLRIDDAVRREQGDG
jgi:dihydropteroate synthase